MCRMLCLGSSALVESINVCFKLQVPIPHPKCLGVELTLDLIFWGRGTIQTTFILDMSPVYTPYTFILYSIFYCACVSTAMCHMRPGVDFPSVLVSALRFWILEDSQLGLSCLLLPCLNERVLKNQVSLPRRSPSLTTLSISTAARHFWPLNSVRHTQMLPLFFVCGSSSVMF